MNKSLKIIVILIAIFIIGFSLSMNRTKNTTIPNDWLIVPSKKIGPIYRKDIDSKNALQKIRNIFGESNIQSTQLSIGEDINIAAYSIYPNTENEIKFHINDKSILFKFPSYNSYFIFNQELSLKAKWRLDNDIKIGDPISKIQKINGEPFELSGFEWDYPGVVQTWRGGSIPDELSIVFIQKAKDLPDNYSEITGEKNIISDNPVLQAVDPVVNFMYIKWDWN